MQGGPDVPDCNLFANDAVKLQILYLFGKNKTSKGKSQSRTNSVKGEDVRLTTSIPQKLHHLVTPGEKKKKKE